MKNKKQKIDTEFSPSELIAIGIIQESKTNPRKHWDEKALKELAESIKQHGILQPLIIRHTGKIVELVSGARRLRAAKLAGLKDVPCIIKDLTDDQVLEIQIIENLQRQDIHPLEEAEGFNNLVKSKKYDVKSIAEKIGKSETYVYQRIQLLKLNPNISEDFKNNKLSYPEARLFARLPEETQSKCYNAIYKQGYYARTVKGINSWLEDNTHRNLNEAPFKIDDSELVKEAGACTSCQYNSAFAKELFPEMSNRKICINPKCFNNKIQAHLDSKVKVFLDKGITPVKITTSYSSTDKLIGEDKYNICKKNETGSKVAIVMDSYNKEKIGQVVYIKDKQSSSGGRISSGKSTSEKINEARGKNNKKVRMMFLDYFYVKIHELIKKPEGLTKELKEIFLKIGYYKLDFDTSNKLKHYYKWDIPKSKNNNGYDYNKFFYDNIQKFLENKHDSDFFAKILTQMLSIVLFSPEYYRSFNDKFEVKHWSPIAPDFIFELSKLMKFDYPGKLKEMNNESVAKLKEKSKPVTKSKKAKK